MDLERKLMKICSSVQELKQTQKQLLQRLDSNKCTSASDNAVEQLTQLDNHVCKLESQFGQHCNSLKEVTELVLKLLDKVQHFNIIIEEVKFSEHTVKEPDVTTCSLSSNTSTRSVEKSPEQRHRLTDLSRLKYLVTRTSVADDISNSYTKLDLTEKKAQNDGKSNSGGSLRGCELEIKSLLDISGFQNIDDNKSCFKGEVKYKTSLALGSVHTLGSFDNNDSEDGQTNIAKNDNGISELIQSKKCIFKNDFGYKRKFSDIKFDNRVSFHSNQTCFQGEMCISKGVTTEEKSDPPNIPVIKRSSKQLSRRSVQAYDENTVVTNPAEVWQPVSTHDWFQFAEQTRIHANFRLQSRSVQRGKRGHDVILVLDTSKRMKGHTFSLLKSKAIEYVTGIKQVYMTSDLEDNIGIVIFGGHSRLVQESTSNYDLIIDLIGRLQPEGDAPLLGGLLLGLAGVLGGASSRIMDYDIPGHMIIFTNGTSAKSTSNFEVGRGIHPSYFVRDVRGDAEIRDVISMIAERSIKIYYVPIGEDLNNVILEKAVTSTCGKIIPSNEIHRLIRMTQVLMLAAEIASAMKYSTTDQSRKMVKKIVMEKTQGKETSFLRRAEYKHVRRTNQLKDDCVDIVLQFLNPLSMTTIKGMYAELNSSSLQLGDRVRRGPHWTYGDQDSKMPGTVVGHDNDDGVWVEWDNGHVNIYVYSEQTGERSLRKVNEKRILVDEMVAVGVKVIRGRDWRFSNYDGGPGSSGTVLNVRPDGTVVVRWDCKRTGRYKIGCNGLFEVQTCDDPYGFSETDMSLNNQSDYESQVWKQTHNKTNIQANAQYTSKTKEHKDSNYIIPIDPTVTAVWKFKHENCTWKLYPKEINARIEKAYKRKPTGKTIIEMNNCTYVVHFTKMVQEDPQSKTEVSVEREDHMAGVFAERENH